MLLPAERPAIAFWQHHPISDQQAATLADATLAFHAEVGGDLVKLTPAGTYQARALGLQDAWQGDPLGRRTIVGRPLAAIEDWLHLDTCTLGEQEAEQLEAAARVRARLGADVPLLATVFSPLTLALQLAGASTWQSHHIDAPEAVEEGLFRLMQRCRHLIRAYRQAGVSGIYYVAQHFAGDELPAATVAPAWLAHDLPVLAEADGLACNMMHFHGVPLPANLPALPAGWLTHYEWCAGNPSPRLQDRRLALGLPEDTLLAAADSAACRRLAEGLWQDVPRPPALITAACVLPPTFPRAVVRRWVVAFGAGTQV